MRQTPTSVPEIFAPNDVSTGHNERDMAISPDGKEIYYSLVGTQAASVIVVRKFVNNQWQSPQIASFSGGWYDIEPAFSPDGKKMFFCSNRPLKTGGVAKDFDIWYVERTANNDWSEPKNVGSPVNTTANEFYPSLTKDGTLYYTAPLVEGLGEEDIVYAKFVNGAYQKPVSLPPPINSKGDEYNAFIDPSEKFIIFGAYKRSDDLGGGDMYICFKNADGTWSDARNLGDKINSKRLDYCPYISPDGKYFFFTSERAKPNDYAGKPLKIADFLKIIDAAGNGKGDIYWVESSAILAK